MYIKIKTTTTTTWENINFSRACAPLFSLFDVLLSNIIIIVILFIYLFFFRYVFTYFYDIYTQKDIQAYIDKQNFDQKIQKGKAWNNLSKWMNIESVF